MYSCNDVSWISQYLILSVNRSAHRFVCLLMQTAAGGIARVAEVWRRKCLNRFWLICQINAAEKTRADYACFFHLRILSSYFTKFRLFPCAHFLFAEFFFFFCAISVYSQIVAFYEQLDLNAERPVFSLVSSSSRCLSLSHLETSWTPAFTTGCWYGFFQTKWRTLTGRSCAVTMACRLHLSLNMQHCLSLVSMVTS